MNKGKLKQLAICLVMSSLLMACSNDMSELEQALDEIKRTPPGTIEPIPEVKVYEKYAYQSGLLRSPFTPDKGEDADGGNGDGPRPDANRNKDFLEDFPLDSLSMVGTISKDGIDYGLVLTPDSLIHQVKPGDYMGQNDGRILAITETGIVLKELVPDGLGSYQYRDNELLLPEDEAS
ncbi:MAG: pilus assembly protein PilP [Gammaproteobacteria bacterium]|nr:pilus assembly protein PilP [Gammaproteobacteria bacterium]NNC97934.1 pilus assembly protein PilP [Gammaproteobacteria bacterium]NNM14268.1 pilus assembly protein PilP [Gammaproteobacteria bacterium]